MGFLDILFCKKSKNNNDKKWFKVLGDLLEKQKQNNIKNDYYYLYDYCAHVYFENFNAGSKTYVRDHYKFFEECEFNKNLNSYENALNNLLPSGLKQNFNDALKLYKQNKTKGWIESKKLFDNVDRYYVTASENEKLILKDMLFDCYKKLLGRV